MLNRVLLTKRLFPVVIMVLVCVLIAQQSTSAQEQPNNPTKGEPGTLIIPASSGIVHPSTQYATRELVTGTNPTEIIVSSGTNGTADLYPSTITISEVTGIVTDVQVTLFNVSHSYAADLDVLLVSPTGRNLIIMSDAGTGFTPEEDTIDASLTFSDGALEGLPTVGPLVTGSYLATNHPGDTGEFGCPADPDTFELPAPLPSTENTTFAEAFADLTSTDVNGDWLLFVMDDCAGDGGIFAGGWQLTIFALNNPEETATAGGETLTPTNTPTETLTPSETPTPTITDTPEDTNTPEPTLDVTETPTFVPTNTSTPYPGVPLLQNGGFELKDSNNDPDLTPWVVGNGTGDKVKCNKDKDGDGVADKIFSNTGDCAFRFKGSIGETSSLTQVVEPNIATFQVGDVLQLNLYGQGGAETFVRAKLRVKYGDGSEKGKINLDVVETTSYVLYTGSYELVSTDITQIKIKISNKSQVGKTVLDDVSLQLLADKQATATTEPTSEVTETATLEVTETETPTEEPSETPTEEPTETPAPRLSGSN